MDEAQRLDDLLWTYNDRSFLPHEIFAGGPAPHARVMVLLGDSAAPPSHRQLVVNLTDAIPAELEQYERVAEIVDVDPGAQAHRPRALQAVSRTRLHARIAQRVNRL